jgi:hypothetical protein
MPQLSSAVPSRKSAAYVAALILAAWIVFNAEMALGLGNARTAQAAAFVGANIAIALLFWPVFALCLANLARREAYRALGGVLHVAAMVTLTLAASDNATLANAIPGALPAALLALTVGWLTVETSQTAAMQRLVHQMAQFGVLPGASTAA